MFGLGWQETVVIFILALLLFGPKKLPELGKNLAKALGEFRRASNELKDTWQREMAAVEKETQDIKREAESFSATVNSTATDPSYNYDYNYEYGGYGYPDSSTTDATSTATETTTAAAAAGELATPEGVVPATGEVEVATNFEEAGGVSDPISHAADSAATPPASTPNQEATATR